MGRSEARRLFAGPRRAAAAPSPPWACVRPPVPPDRPRRPHHRLGGAFALQFGRIVRGAHQHRAVYSASRLGGWRGDPGNDETRHARLVLASWFGGHRFGARPGRTLRPVLLGRPFVIHLRYSPALRRVDAGGSLLALNPHSGTR